MADKRSIINLFHNRFEELTKAVENDPRRLLQVPIKDAALLNLVGDVKKAADKVERLQSQTKVLQNVDARFIKRWKQYLGEWKMQVEYVTSQPLLGWPDDKWPSFEEFCRTNPKLSPEDPDPEWYPFDFDPLKHDGGPAVIRLIETIREYQEIASERVPDPSEDDDDDPLGERFEDLSREANVLTVGLQAIDFFQENIGINISKSFRRWNKLHQILIPMRVSDIYDSSGKNPLFELLNDAIRSYVVGAPASAVAMCRAALEMVLRDYYLADQTLEERVTLDKIINLAVARYKFLDKEKLRSMKGDGNKILHNYTRHRALLDEDEEKLVTLFDDLRHWIEKAPDAKR